MRSPLSFKHFIGSRRAAVRIRTCTFPIVTVSSHTIYKTHFRRAVTRSSFAPFGQPRTITFSASATTSLSTSAIANGTYLPTDLAGAPDTFPSPAPSSGWTSNLSTLGDTTANGVWKLYIRDNLTGPNGFAGLLTGGVQLTVRSKP